MLIKGEMFAFPLLVVAPPFHVSPSSFHTHTFLCLGSELSSESRFVQDEGGPL